MIKKILFALLFLPNLSHAGFINISNGGSGSMTIASGTGGNLGQVIFSSNTAVSATSFSITTHTIAGSADGNSLTTPAINTAGSSLIIVGLTFFTGASTPILTDSKSNVWTKLAVSSVTSNLAAVLYYSTNPTVGAGHTFSENVTISFPSIAVLALSGSTTLTPFDQENGNSNGSSASSIQTGSVTPTADNEILVSVVGGDQATAFGIDSSFIISDQIPAAGNNYSTGLAYIIKGAGSSGSAVNPTWSSSSVKLVTRIATFKVL